MELKKITIEANIPERWENEFLDLLATMQFCGAVGTSQELTFYSDGDGDFFPKFYVNGNPIDMRRIRVRDTEKLRKEFDAG